MLSTLLFFKKYSRVFYTSTVRRLATATRQRRSSSVFGKPAPVRHASVAGRLGNCAGPGDRQVRFTSVCVVCHALFSALLALCACAPPWPPPCLASLPPFRPPARLRLRCCQPLGADEERTTGQCHSDAHAPPGCCRADEDAARAAFAADPQGVAPGMTFEQMEQRVGDLWEFKRGVKKTLPEVSCPPTPIASRGKSGPRAASAGWPLGQRWRPTAQSCSGPLVRTDLRRVRQGRLQRPHRPRTPPLLEVPQAEEGRSPARSDALPASGPVPLCYFCCRCLLCLLCLRHEPVLYMPAICLCHCSAACVLARRAVLVSPPVSACLAASAKPRWRSVATLIIRFPTTC